ncbi:YibE/F family protein, partial [Enterococcus faecalis]|nr:YibE/F family protein [Enterococcus faecalis]EKS9979210.1 YibE/F family protein [Enterococcus faecalis]HDL2265375.1 YibE/F family protein [Enterococcus faecium]
AGKKGFFSLVGILFNIIFLFFLLWINQRNRSINLLLLISIYTIIAIIISTGTLYGLKKIDLRKVLATIFSVFLSYFITTITMKLLNDQGLRYEEMQFLTRPYRTVFLASLMLGGIGAALDNVVVIISSLDQLVRHTPEINTKELIESGKNIASDTTTSMINVLLFAYLSSATPFFIFYLANGWDFVETFKMHLSLEIMRILCGGLAILFTIPSSFLFFLLFKKIKKEGENR